LHRRGRPRDDRRGPPARGTGPARRPRSAGGEVTSDPPPLAETAGQPAARCDAARLEVQDLAIRIGDQSGHDVVSEICLTVPAGEELGLVGESGSGKTTVALPLLGHSPRGLSITGGQVRLYGLDLLLL